MPEPVPEILLEPVPEEPPALQTLQEKPKQKLLQFPVPSTPATQIDHEGSLSDSVVVGHGNTSLPAFAAIKNRLTTPKKALSAPSKITVYGAQGDMNVKALNSKAFDVRTRQRKLPPNQHAVHSEKAMRQVNLELIDPSIIDKPTREMCHPVAPRSLLETSGKLMSLFLLVVSYLLPFASFFLDVTAAVPETGFSACRGYLIGRGVLFTVLLVASVIFIALNFRRQRRKWRAEQFYVLAALLILLFENGKQGYKVAFSEMPPWQGEPCNDDFDIAKSADLRFLRVLNFAFTFLILEVFTSNCRYLPSPIAHIIVGVVALAELIFLWYFPRPDTVEEEADKAFVYNSAQWFETVRLFLLAHKTYVAYMELSSMSFLRTRSRQMGFWLISGPFAVECIIRLLFRQLVNLHRIFEHTDLAVTTFAGEICATEIKILLLAFAFAAPSQRSVAERQEQRLRVVRLEKSLCEEEEVRLPGVYKQARTKARRYNIGADVHVVEQGDMLRPTFCLETACWAFNCSYLVYFDEPSLGLPSEMKQDDLNQCNLKLRKFFTDGQSSQSGCIFSDAEKPWDVYVAFRGTASLTDVLTDIKAWAKLVEFGHNGEQSFWVHNGFNRSYNTVGAFARMALDDYLSRLNSLGTPSHNISITFCGHSLGGAMATLMAVHSVDWLHSLGITRIRVYTIGAPRIGDAKFAKYANSRIPHIFRIVGSADPVPRVPGKKVGAAMLCVGCPVLLKLVSLASNTDKSVVLRYKHCGYEVVINQTGVGDLIIDPEPSDYFFFLNWRPIPTAHLVGPYRAGLLASVWQLRGEDSEHNSEYSAVIATE